MTAAGREGFFISARKQRLLIEALRKAAPFCCCQRHAWLRGSSRTAGERLTRWRCEPPTQLLADVKHFKVSTSCRNRCVCTCPRETSKLCELPLPPPSAAPPLHPPRLDASLLSCSHDSLCDFVQIRLKIPAASLSTEAFYQDVRTWWRLEILHQGTRQDAMSSLRARRTSLMQ